MPEDFVVVTAAAQRLRSYGLGAYLDAFGVRLAELGYRPATIRSKLGVLGDLARWMELERVAVADLDERRVDAFLAARRRHGRTGRGGRRTALQLLEQLRGAGLVRAPEPAPDATPAAALLARYEHDLRVERALAPATVKGYRPFVRAFVLERLAGDATRPGDLRARDVRDFLLVRVRGMASSGVRVDGGSGWGVTPNPRR